MGNWFNTVDDIQQRMKCGISAALGIYELMNGGNCSPESYLDALYASCDYLQMLNEELARAATDMREVAKG